MNSSFKENCRQWIFCLALILGLVSANVSQAQSRDSDGDGVNDPVEIADGTNPNDASSYNNLNKGLVAYYPFNGNANDESGNGRHGAASNAVLAADRNGGSNGSYQFNGTSSRVVASASDWPSGNSSRTVSLWLKANAMQGNLFSFGDAAVNKRFSALLGWGGSQATAFVPEGDNANFTSGDFSGTGWRHLVLTWNNGTGAFFIDGIKKVEFSRTVDTDGSKPLVLGANVSGQESEFFSGLLDDVRVYGRALSDTEVAQLYGQEVDPAASVSEVLARWDFSGGLGPTSTAAGISANSVSVVGANPIYPPVYTGNPSPAAEARAWLGGRDNGRYYTFRLTNNLTVAVPVTSIRMDLRNESPGIGPTGFAVMSSADNYASDVATGTLDWSTRAWVNVNAKMNTVLQPGQALEFRVTGWGANSIPPQGGHLIMDNVVVMGGASDTDGDGLSDAWEMGYGRYQIITGNFTWPQAKVDAEARGGHLGTITSEAEWGLIRASLEASFQGFTRVWLGATDAEQEGVWKWITGETFSYQRWAASGPTWPAEPRDGSSANHLDWMESFKDYAWNDETNTDVKSAYLLEFGYPTDPTKPDTDGDGVDDKTESLAGTDPNDSSINSWDFVHSYKNVYSGNALDYVFDQQNITRVSEGGITYWSPAAGGQEARLTQKFVFNRPTASAFLHINYIYVASFSGAGSGSLWASKDGNEWTRLVDAPTPSFAAGYGFNDYLPKNLMGSNEIWIQARLQSSGWNIMAQFLRYDAAWRTDNAFDLKVRLDSHDTSPPIITLIGSNPLEIYKGSAFTDPGAMVTDNKDATRSITGSGTVNTGTVGIYTLTYTATDAAGNLAVPVTRTVNVVLDPAADEDGDGLTNGTEISGGTNPYQRDSDGDGVNDPVEIADGTNPNDASSFNNLNKGLVAYYPFNGNANDESGNGYHATNIGGTFVVGLRQQNSGSLHFDGASAYAQSSISNLPLQNSPRTLSLWIKSELRPDLLANEHIVGYGSFPPTEGFGVGIYAGSGGRLFGYCSFNDIPSDKYADSGWVHFVHVYDGLESRIYADGLLVGSLRQQLMTQGNDAFTLGARQATDSANQIVNFYRGSLDDVRLYNRALSSAEIALMYENQASSLDTDGDGLTDAWERGYGRFEVIPGNFTWDQAKADAESRGGHLATFTSNAEWQTVATMLSAYPSQILWLGATDREVEGTWRWVTGEPWSFYTWGQGQPDNSGDEDRLSIWMAEDGSSPGWNDFGAAWRGHLIPYVLETGYPTDPTKADTDGDGFNDKVESLGGGDPNNAASLPRLIANNDTVDRDGRNGSSTAIALSQLLGNDQYTTPTPPTVSLPSRTTAQGGSVLLENGWVIYTGLSGLASSAGDSFGYRITDSLGNKADGMVFLNAGIYSSGVNIVRVVGATPPATGVISYFAVIPNKRYTVYATSSLSPVNWSNLGTFTSDSKGQLAVPDPIVASSRFYKMEVLFP